MTAATFFFALFAFVYLGSTVSAFTDAQIFERLQHFKDNGIPGTVNDIVNQAMIADGTCRLFVEQEGYTFWHNRNAVIEIIDAIKELPDTSHPSNLVLTAHDALTKKCQQHFARMGVVGDMNPRLIEQPKYGCLDGSYDLAVMAQSMNNWQRALCAGKNDSAWNGIFDPAYQAQQVSLTSGFMCIIACDCNMKQNLPKETFTSIAMNPETAKDTLCKSTPWRETNFTRATADLKLFAALSSPLVDNLCRCS